MKKTNISHLKSHLSEFLNFVRKGEEVFVFERRNIIAKIVRVNPRDEVLLPDMLHELVLEGLLEPAKHHLPKDFFADMPRAKASVLDALIAEREEGL